MRIIALLFHQIFFLEMGRPSVDAACGTGSVELRPLLYVAAVPEKQNTVDRWSGGSLWRFGTGSLLLEDSTFKKRSESLVEYD